MRIFALLLLAISVPSFAGVCERDSWYERAAHTIEYRPGPKLQPGDTFKISGWDRPFIMSALPFTEFGHAKNEAGEPKMWALHFPIYQDRAEQDGQYYEPVTSDISVYHVKTDDCTDLAIAGGPQPRHDVPVVERRNFEPRRKVIDEYDVEYRDWPSTGVVNSYTTTRSVYTQLRFVQNGTELTLYVNLDNRPLIKREGSSGEYIYRVTESGSKLSELEGTCYGGSGYYYDFDYDELDENLKVPLGPVAIASQCTLDDAPIYDYRAYLDPERHREYPTSLFYRLKQIIKYIYIEPLN